MLTLLSSGSSRCVDVLTRRARVARQTQSSRSVRVLCCSGAVPGPSPLKRRAFLASGAAGLALAGSVATAASGQAGEVSHSDEEWKQLLTPAQYNVLRKAGTEFPNSSPLNKEKRRGTFVCAGCSSPLFSSSTKYNSGTGWPSFYDPLPGAVALQTDASIPFMVRTEVLCKTCGGHLGHVFNDGPQPTGERYCMNGVAMNFVPQEAAAA